MVWGMAVSTTQHRVIFARSPELCEKRQGKKKRREARTTEARDAKRKAVKRGERKKERKKSMAWRKLLG
jgi:hypothetical protein